MIKKLTLFLYILSMSLMFATSDGIKTREGLSRVYQVLTTKTKARVAFLGGSITEMQGWHNMVAKDLLKRFPKVKFDFIFGGIGSTDSTMGAFRIEKDIFKNGKIDLLFIESAVNELHNSRKKGEIIRGVEGIIRHAILHNPEISIIAQYFYDPRYLSQVDNGIIPWQISTLNQISEHYNIASINQVIRLKSAISNNEITMKQFGGVHPKKAGHRLYADNVSLLFDRALTKGKASKKRLPKALSQFNYQNGHYLDIRKIKLTKGWRYIPNWTTKLGKTRKQFNQIPLLEASTPGATLKISFTGSAFGLTLPAGPDIGIIEYAIDGGKIKELDLFTAWSKGLHIPWIYMLATELEPGNHTITIRISSNKNKKSKGTYCRIAFIAVN